MALPVEVPTREQDKTDLRVAFERGGRLVGTAYSRSGRVRWGPSLGIEFAYPVPGVDAWEELFSAQRDGARLHLHEGMTGRLSAGEASLALTDLELWGLVERRGRTRTVRLTRDMEGEVEYRGMVISFGFGPPPPVEPGAALGRVPLRFRRGLLAREEIPFALLNWALYGLLLYLSLHLTGLPLPEAPEPERVATRFARLIYEAPQAATRARTEILKRAEESTAAQEEAPPETKPEPEPEAPPPPEPVAEAAPPSQPAEAPAPPAPPAPQAEPAAAGPPPKAVPTREQIREQVARKGLLGLLGGRGAAATSKSRGSILEGRGKAEDLDRVLESVEGLRAAPTGGGGDGLGDGAGGLPGGVDEQARAAAGAGQRVVQLAERDDQVVEAAEEEPLDELTLKEAVAVIHKTVGTYLGGIRYLYNRELRKNPDLEGKLTVSITISPEGLVSECHVTESSLEAPELVDAVLARIRKWTFPPVAKKPLTVTYPFVFFPSM